MSKIELQKGATARETGRNQQRRRKLATPCLKTLSPSVSLSSSSFKVGLER